jgi:hypothetical protein
MKNHNNHSLVPVLCKCAECGKNCEMVGGNQIYPHRDDLASKNFYLCKCGAYVGTHPETCEPLGTAAGPTTRKARSEAHAHFDPLWKAVGKMKPEGGSPRKRGYKWLAEKMGLTVDECHIGMMSSQQAREVIGICRPYLEKYGILPERRR